MPSSFFNSLTFLSKKGLDYQDWVLVLRLKINGQHFTVFVFFFFSASCKKKKKPKKRGRATVNPLNCSENE